MDVTVRRQYYEIKRRRYFIIAAQEGSTHVLCIWRYFEDVPKWYMLTYSKEYGLNRCDELNALGVRSVFNHFGLQMLRRIIPTSRLVEMPPVALIRIRRILEGEDRFLLVLKPRSASRYEPAPAMFTR
jgi:hypothetical protein